MEGTLAMLDVVVVHQPNPLPPSSEDNPAAEATRGLENAIARSRLIPMQVQVEWLDQEDE